MFQKVLITGATGFIGTRFCERLTLVYQQPYKTLVRNFARANRIARMNAEMVGGDLLNQNSLQRALADCDAVVHLAHSEDSTALRETKSLLKACAQANIKRFVHVSSVAVHGPAPGPLDGAEGTAIIRTHTDDPYCNAKAKVELAVHRAIQRLKFPAIIIRPTIVYGPYSPFVLQVIRSAHQGQIVLIDDGKCICNAVYVDDVCDAIWKALCAPDSVHGQAFFINADQPVTWRDFTLGFATMVSPPPSVGSVSAGESLLHAVDNNGLTYNFRAFIRLLASPAFHQQLATIPWLGNPIRWTKQTLVQHMSEEQVLLLKNRLGARKQSAAPPSRAWPSKTRVIRETCAVAFANSLAKSTLAWQPKYSFPQGAALTRTWLKFAKLLEAPE